MITANTFHMIQLQKIKMMIDSWGTAWDVLVITLAIIAFMAWMDLFIGNRIRAGSESMPGILWELFTNWYNRKKNILKAESKHFAFGKKYWVVPIGGRYYVINKSQRQRINRILDKYHMKMDIYDLIKDAVYSTN